MTDRPTIFALSSGRPPAAIAVIRISGSRAGDALKGAGRQNPRAAQGGARPHPRRRQRDHRRGAGAVVSRAEQRDRRGHRRAATARRPRGDRRRARRARPHRGPAPGRGRRVHPPRLRERQARPHRGRGPRRSGLRRDARPAPPGLPADEGPARRPRRDLAAAADPGAGAGRSRDRFFRRRRRARGPGRSRRLEMARELAGEIEAALADGGRGERLRDGLVVAIAGPPNAGKSTLLNRWPGARRRSSRRMPAPPATSSRCISSSAACR